MWEAICRTGRVSLGEDDVPPERRSISQSGSANWHRACQAVKPCHGGISVPGHYSPINEAFSRITHQPWPPIQLAPKTGLMDLFEVGRGILCVGEASIITPLMFSPLSRPVEGAQKAAVERTAQEILAALYTYDDNDPAAWKRRASTVMAIEGRGQVLEELFLRRVLRPLPGSKIGNVQLLDLGLAQQMGGLFVLADVSFSCQRDGHTETEKVIIVMRRDLNGQPQGVLIL